MHFHVELVTDKVPTEAEIEKLMAPFYEGEGEQADVFAWDWWQVGGRWKGVHAEGYDAENDPSHKEVCDLCKGTGKRTDMVVQDGCNGCHGTGIKTTWPTQWGPHEMDTIPVEKVPEGLSCYCLIHGGKAYPKETWTGKTFVETKESGSTVRQILKKLKVKSGYITTIDCHC